MNFQAINRSPTGQTMLIQSSQSNASIHVPRTINWSDIELPKEWSLTNESFKPELIRHNLGDLDYIQQYLDGTVKISFDRDSQSTPKSNLLIEEVARSSASRSEVPRSRSSRQPKDKTPARHLFAGSTSTEELKRRDLELEKELRKLKLKGVQTTSQVSHPCYTADTQLEDEESQEGNASPTESDFIVETVVDPQLCTLRKPFKIDFDFLEIDFDSASNLEKRKAYKERFNLEQKKGILSHFKKHLCEIEMNISYFDFVDEFYPVENKVQTISKEKWVKEDNTVVSSSHPPQEAIVFQHRTTTVKASPFKVASENTDVKKVIEQANYTNQYLNSIGNQLDKIEEKIDNKPLLKEKHKPLKSEKPIIKFPEIKSGTSLKVNKDKPFVEKIEDMLKDLVKTKQEQPSSSNTLSVTNIPESSEDSSETESSSESDLDDNIRKVEKALSALELNRIHKPKFSPTSITKNWYPRPTPPNIQFEERSFQSQFAVSADKLYEWNIDGLA
jgi:hypothetical protein